MEAEKVNILSTFSRALQREAHILQDHPELLWQQLYNRLQWETTPVRDLLGPQLAARRSPWIRTWSPFTESQPLIRTLSGHLKKILTCAISPDGSFIVSGSQDETLKVWDGDKGEERFTLAGHASWVTACAISPDSRLIVSAGWDNTIKVWDAGTGQEINTFKGHKGRINACAVSPSGRYLLTASDDGTLILWDFPAGSKPVTFRGHTKPVTDCAFSPDESFMLSASEDETLRIWAGEDTILHEHSGAVKGCAISPDGRLIVSAGRDFTLRTWERNRSWTSSAINPQPHLLMVNSCTISPDGRLIASWSSLLSPNITIWDVRRRAKLLKLEGHEDTVSDCVFSPDGRQFITASADRTLKVWDVQAIFREAGSVKEESGQASRTDLPGWTEQHAHIFVTVDTWSKSARSGSLKPWGFSGRELIGTLSPDMRYLVSTDKDRRFQLWDTANKKECAVHGKMPFTFSPDSRSIVSVNDGRLHVWDPVTGETLAKTENHAPIHDIAISPDGRSMLSIGSGAVRMWDMETGEIRHTLDDGYGLSCAFSPDGRWIYSSYKWLKIWEADTGREVALLHLPWIVNAKHTHPAHPFFVSGTGENIRLVELQGIDYFPPLITPVVTEEGTTLTCPDCWQSFDYEPDYAGNVITCPQAACQTSLAVCPDTPLIDPTPDDVEVDQLKHFILTYTHNGDDEKLLQVLDRIEIAEPFVPAFKLSRAEALIRLGHYREAVDFLELVRKKRWVESDEDVSRAIYMQGIAYASLGDDYMLGADAAVKQAEARFKWAWWNLNDDQREMEKGFTELSLRRFSEADALFRPTAERDSPLPIGCWGLALALLGQGKTEEACPWIQRFLTNPGDDSAEFIERAQKTYAANCQKGTWA